MADGSAPSIPSTGACQMAIAGRWRTCEYLNWWAGWRGRYLRATDDRSSIPKSAVCWKNFRKSAISAFLEPTGLTPDWLTSAAVRLLWALDEVGCESNRRVRAIHRFLSLPPFEGAWEEREGYAYGRGLVSKGAHHFSSMPSAISSNRRLSSVFRRRISSTTLCASRASSSRIQSLALCASKVN